MFDEMDLAAGLQDASHLRQRAFQVRDSAERPGGEHGIESFGREVEALASETGRLHRNW